MALVRLLGERLLTTGRKAVPTAEALRGASAVGLYFSASWCPPCRGFTPVLVESYTQVLAKKGLRCVLVSWDRDEEAFNGYFSQMPWLALPYEDRNQSASRTASLGEKFGVRSIPTLALVDPDGKTITTEAREALVQDRDGEHFPWHPPLVRDLAHGNPGRVNELPSVLCLCESADGASQQRALDCMTSVAQTWSPTRGPEGTYSYFIGSGGPLCARIRELCGLPVQGPPRLVLLDIADQGGFYLGHEGEDALQESTMRKLLSDFEAAVLERKQLAPP